jgi:NAD dependent epimerase/dehydratase
MGIVGNRSKSQEETSTQFRAEEAPLTLQGLSVLVTGAGGFLGSHLAERLVQEGARVRALVHYNARGSAGWLDHSKLATEMEILAGDVCDAGSCESAVRRCAIVFHLAALTTVPYSYQAPASFVKANIDGTLNMLVASRRVGVERFIQASSSQTYGTARRIPIDESHPLQAQSPYAATKIACDSLVETWHRAYNLPTTILKIFCTFGPRQSVRNVVPTIITQLLDGQIVRLGNLGPLRDYNFFEDSIDAYVRAATVPEAIGATYNICGRNEISIGDLAHLIARLMDVDLKIVEDPSRMRPASSEVNRLLGDSTAAKAALGWEQRVGLEAGLRRTISWYRENKALVTPMLEGVFV